MADKQSWLSAGLRRFHVDESLAGPDHFLGQADHLQETDRQPRKVDFEPAMAVLRTALIGVMVVVPPFTVADEADEPVVAAVLVGLVVAIAPNVGQRVYAPGDVPDGDRPHEHAPNEQAPAELRCRGQ